MALVLEALTMIQQVVNRWMHQPPQKNDAPLKVGVISSATINVSGIIEPVGTHPDVLLWGIASRSPAAAESYAQKHGFKISYPSYDALLDDPRIDFVYISLPNALHYEWAKKSLEAGKHVLLEKPFTNNAVEAESLFSLAKEKGLVLCEAMHWMFHPAAHRFREILQEGGLGRIVRTDARMTATPAVPKNDIRWKYELGGGSLMDLSYVVSFTRFALGGGTPDEIVSAQAVPAPHDKRLDQSMHATLRFKEKGKMNSIGVGEHDVYSTIYTDLSRPWLYGIIPRIWEFPSILVETKHAEVYFFNAQCPHVYHYIAITDKATRRTRYEQCYSGGPLWGKAKKVGPGGDGLAATGRGEAWWSTYRYQLESFVDKVRGREPVWWISEEETTLEMKTVDEIYRKSGMPIRMTSEELMKP